VTHPVVLGCDPALGGGNAVIACALADDRLYVLDCDYRRGLSKTEEQIAIIESMARRYRPHMLILEFDAQQKGLGNDDRLDTLSRLLGFTIKPHLTRGNKNMDQVFGVASMDQSFKRGEIRIPWGDDDTKRRMEEFVKQLRKWRPDIATKNLTQDAVMALWMVWRHWMQVRAAQEPQVVHQSRPTWLTKSPTQYLTRRAG
jgi:hypothetical protein